MVTSMDPSLKMALPFFYNQTSLPKPGGDQFKNLGVEIKRSLIPWEMLDSFNSTVH
jgi:hypothetical protein